MAFWNRSSSNTLTDVDILSCWPRGVENDEEKFYLILPGFYMILTSLRTVHTFLASPACKAVFLAEDLRKSTLVQLLATCQLRWYYTRGRGGIPVNLVSNYPCASERERASDR